MEERLVHTVSAWAYSLQPLRSQAVFLRTRCQARNEKMVPKRAKGQGSVTGRNKALNWPHSRPDFIAR